MPEHVRKARVCEWNRDRLMQIIDYLEAIPGHELQLALPDFAAGIGIPVAALKRHLDWARRYGIVEVSHRYEFAQGRTPNIYTLILDRATWEEEGRGIVDRWQAEKAAEQPVRRGKVGGYASTLEPGQAPGADWMDVR